LVRVLAVNVHKAIAQFTQLRQRGRHAVDIAAAAALGVDHPAQREFVACIKVAFGEPGAQGVGGVEDGGDVGARRAFAQYPSASASASIRMDLPAPVSPENTVKPGPKWISACSTMTKSRICRVRSMFRCYSTLSDACGIRFQCNLRRSVEKKLYPSGCTNRI